MTTWPSEKLVTLNRAADHIYGAETLLKAAANLLRELRQDTAAEDIETLCAASHEEAGLLRKMVEMLSVDKEAS